MTNFKIVKNEERDGLELYFSEKPEMKVINFLKENHFRWHNVKKCWYNHNNNKTVECIKELQKGDLKANKEVKNTNFKYNVKVGDIFYISWGYEQTNLDFFKVVKLCGTQSVRIVEVGMKIKEQSGVSDMSRNVSYDIETAEPLEKGFFIKDQVNGDLFRIKSFNKDDFNYPEIWINGRYPAELYKGEELYESWYA